MRTIIWTIGKAARRLVTDFEITAPVAAELQKSASAASDVSLLKIVINIVRPPAR